ncbi:mannosyltransferase [Comamonas serinivorans]|uniref:mannosyltransferase n=1 Tax=Comamonas serinivorans TaxID=1082851 RepID=UPI0012FA9D96|nr:mannosyltransferase [Comamonas serinivorans]
MLLLALSLRLVAASLPGFHHPDEVWQYLEPAHHLAFGRWVSAWEFRDGIRTWLIPLALAGPMKLGQVIAPDTGLYLALPKLLLVLLSLSVVACATTIGLRTSPLHGLLAGGVTAVWAELVYFAPRALSEPVGMALFFIAAWLLSRPVASATPRLWLLAGAVLGLAFCARFQYAPALLVLAAWHGRRHARAWGWLVLGGLAGLAIDGAIDAAVGDHPPWRWILANFRINLLDNKSAQWGVAPAHWYLTELPATWRWATVLIVPPALLGARRQPVLLLAALVNLAAHALIPHKEYRFVLLSVALLVVLAALGTADLVRGAPGSRLSPRARVVAAGLVWVLASAQVAFLGPLKPQWQAGHALVSALQAAGAVSHACGVALYRHRAVPVFAYAFYHRDTPLYTFSVADDINAARQYSSAFNILIAPRDAPTLNDAFTLKACTSDSYCVYQRAGPCSSKVPPRHVNTPVGGP